MEESFYQPFARFDQWFGQALDAAEAMPEAASLGTVDAAGASHARMVLVKTVSPEQGFVFYTNLESNKAKQIAGNNRVSLCFHWKSLARQVRVVGLAFPVPEAMADAYFATRPRASQIGAWASAQSRKIEPAGAPLEARMAEIEQRFEGRDVERPPFWSGFSVLPLVIEFWEEGAHRLHKRLVFERKSVYDSWLSYHLFP